MLLDEDRRPGLPGDGGERPVNGGLARPVILGDEAGQWLAEEGLVTSAGPEVLTISTGASFGLGERLFIEFPVDIPGESHRTAIIRGRVAGVREEGGGYVLDVRLTLMPDVAVTDIVTLPLSRGEAEAMIQEAREDLETAGKAGALPVADITRFLETPRTQQAPETPHRHWRYGLAAAGVVCAIIVLLYLFSPASSLRTPRWEVTGLPGVMPVVTPEEATRDSGNPSLGRGGSLGAGPGSEGASPSEPALGAWRPGAWVRIDDDGGARENMAGTEPPDIGPLFSPIGWVMAAMRPLLKPDPEGGVTPLAPAFIVAEMLEPDGHAAADASEPVTGECLPVPEESGSATQDLPTSSGVPAEKGPAPAEAEESSSGDAAAGTGAASQAPPSHAVPEASSAGDSDGSPPDAEREAQALPAITVPERVEISVDKSDYTLTIRVDGGVAAQFPVGLGRNNATPEGEFTIANKVTDPDWSDRGRIVKAGDPANPLGRRWMGLGSGGRTTSYGIHPTTEPQSIGAGMSRGCIRMRPEDAETVFRLCPVGTTVCIIP